MQNTMPPENGNIKALHAGKNAKGITLRLVRKYEVPDFYGGKKPASLECVFHDDEGQRIHATIGKMHFDKFADILIEGSLYSIVDFVVGANRMNLKTTTSEHKLLIYKCTRIFEIYREEYPKRMFEFKTFDQVKAMDNNAATFDVIGIVVCSYNPQMINCSGKTKRMMKVVLEDLEGDTIRCTLWEKYADQMHEYIQTGPEAPPGIILQFCSTNLFRGEIEIQNCFDITKLNLDQEHPEIKAVKASFMSMAGKGTLSTITTMTTTTSSTQSIADEHRQGGLKVKTLAELQKDGEEGEFLVAATVVCVEYAKDWAYQACKICRKKLQTEGQTMVCTTCGMADAKAVLRYKLIVRVVDETDTALFLFWDKESVAMIGKKAADLSHSEDLQTVPPEVDAAVANKEAIFKVIVEQKNRASEQVFPVLKIERDSDIIKAITGKGKEQVGPESVYNLGDQSAKHNETVGSCSDSYTTPLDSESRQGNEVQQCEEDLPAKNLIDEFSTTIPKKRLKRLKQEK